MFLYQVYAIRYSASSKLSAHIIVKDETAHIQIELTADEQAQLDRIGEAVFTRHQATLAAKMAKPLETMQLPAPVEDADFEEVIF